VGDNIQQQGECRISHRQGREHQPYPKQSDFIVHIAIRPSAPIPPTCESQAWASSRCAVEGKKMSQSYEAAEKQAINYCNTYMEPNHDAAREEVGLIEPSNNLSNKMRGVLVNAVNQSAQWID
jgi:hypothetical protein